MADFIQTNINLTEEDDQHVDVMMREDGLDNRSAFIRRLVRLEWQRRQIARVREVYHGQQQPTGE